MTRLDAWDELAAENADLRAQLQAAQEFNHNLNTENADLMAEIERLRGENVELKAERVILRNTLDERERNLSAWQDRYFTLERLAALTPEGTPYDPRKGKA